MVNDQAQNNFADLRIKTLIVGQLQENCHLLIEEQTSEAIIVDPGDDADYITRALRDEQAKPVLLVATHGHFDHIMAATELQLAYNIPFLIHQKDEFLLKHLRQSTRHFLGLDSGPPPKISDNLAAGQTIPLTKSTLEVIETPGHTPGSLSLYHSARKFVLVGDLMFADGGVGRTDFSYSNPGDLEESIQKILRLPEDTLILPGHGAETTVGRERHFHK